MRLFFESLRHVSQGAAQIEFDDCTCLVVKHQHGLRATLVNDFFNGDGHSFQFA